MTLGHEVQNGGETSLGKYQNIKELAKRTGVTGKDVIVLICLCAVISTTTRFSTTPLSFSGVEFYIAVASTLEEEAATKAGNLDAPTNAGGKGLPAGCGPIIALGISPPNDGEVGIPATNRSFKGMESREALAYLASPEVVAASEMNGFIAGSGNYNGSSSAASISPTLTSPILNPVLERLGNRNRDTPRPPPLMEGEIAFCDHSREQMAQVYWENYGSSFPTILKPSDILFAGFNFGCGSSLEQAVTPIFARSIKLVVAGSFSNIFMGNSINNSLVTVELGNLIERLREKFPKMLTRRRGWSLRWDGCTSKVIVREGPEDAEEWSLGVGELPLHVQDVFVKGG
ncbi:Aconitase/3-isopropylmalate dehydratase [Tuber borchii]|uniref:Aconitase/3-isopropylmalate dehydratase n=1 Tax=Tuber borchii TaxID=42251 RepID=A0A2T6ZP48_TUBBO|nr:Aconitase/3-isopropylmalate dehydratase [Tuber borchii]